MTDAPTLSAPTAHHQAAQPSKPAHLRLVFCGGGSKNELLLLRSVGFGNFFVPELGSAQRLS